MSIDTMVTVGAIVYLAVTYWLDRKVARELADLRLEVRRDHGDGIKWAGEVAR